MYKIIIYVILSSIAVSGYAQTAQEFIDAGDALYNKGQYKEAVDNYKQALEKRNTLKDLTVAYLLNSLGWAYKDQELYDQAEPFFIESKDIYEKIRGKEHTDYIRACGDLAGLYKVWKSYTKAEQLYIEAKDLRAKVLGKEHPDYESSCMMLAKLYFMQGLYKQAEPLYLESKNIREKISGKNHENYIYSCYGLASLYFAQGFYDKAEPYYLEEKLLEEKTLGKDHPDYVLTCQSLGDLYYKQGLYDKAEPLYLEAKDIRLKTMGKEHPDYIVSCTSLGNLYSDQDLYPEAEPWYLEAKSICEKQFGKDHPNYARTCNNLAIFYLDQGLYSKAEPLYLESKNIREKLFGKDHEDYALSCHGLALLYYKQGLYNKAEALFSEAKNIRGKTLGKDHPDYASSCNALGVLYTKQGFYSKAEPLYFEARNIYNQVFGKEHYKYAMSCNNLAYLYSEQGLYTKAEPFFLEAKSIYDHVFGKNHQDYAMACYNLAYLYARQGLHSKAEPFFDELIRNKLKQIEELLPTLSEKERDEFYRSINRYFSVYYDFVIKAEKPALYAELFNLQLRIKGLIFQSTQKMHNQIMKSGNAVLIKKYENWKTQREILNNYMQLPAEERAKRNLNLDSINTRINDLERELSRESEIFASTQSRKKYTWHDLQKKLLPNEAAVEIIRTDSAYIALIVKPATKNNPEAVVLSNGAELEKKFIKYYRSCITHKIDDELSYNNFWKPIQEKLGTVSKVYVSADGIYHQLNLLTLKNPVSKKYLLDETNIQLISNLKDLLAVKPDELSQRYENYKIHLIAYPKYDGGEPAKNNDQINVHDDIKKDTSQRFFDRGGKITMLPGTKVEAGNIVTVCSRHNLKPEVKLLEEATEEYLKSLNNPTILHIATHGFFMPSAEASQDGRSLAGEELQTYAKDPLLNSGLLFANAQQGLSGQISQGEDGVLTAKEALNLNLDKTELVIMSACETGLGEIRNGEGVYGLQRSFQQAGAKTVVISLWKVSDEATQELMSNFYTNLLSKKLSKREAFKQAQASLMLKYPEPYYWGAFVMVGE
jgi:CHAT domain-containing protein/plasmid replication initiation protein